MQRIKETFTIYGKSTVLTLALLAAFSSVVFFLSVKDTDKLTISFIDVGQGDSILIQTPSHKTMIIDGGPGNAVMRTLTHKLSFFNNDIDVVLPTHPDADHVTGLIDVIKQYSVHMIVESPAKSETGVFQKLEQAVHDEEGAEHYIGNLGDSIDFGDGVTFTIVSPRTEVWHGEDTNDESVTGVLRYGDTTFLLTGDLPSTHEDDVIATGLVPRNITVLKAGHHGSKFSSSDIFLKYLKPTYTIISAGKDNRYGHPNPEALARIEKESKSILSTIDHGTITFETDGRNLQINTEK